jgi:hypothetical protein
MKAVMCWGEGFRLLKVKIPSCQPAGRLESFPSSLHLPLYPPPQLDGGSDPHLQDPPSGAGTSTWEIAFARNSSVPPWVDAAPMNVVTTASAGDKITSAHSPFSTDGDSAVAFSQGTGSDDGGGSSRHFRSCFSQTSCKVRA